MQYAEILLNQKTREWNETFSYAITPEILPQITIGSIVKVPFQNRFLEGVIVRLRPNIAKRLQGKIKPINKLRQPGWNLSIDELNFGKWLAENFYSSWGEAIFAFLPKPPSKSINNSALIQSRQKSSRGHHYIIWQKDDLRWQNYLSIIKRTRLKDKNIVIIFPDMMRLKQFYQLLITQINPSEILVYRGAGDIQTRWGNWLQLRAGKKPIVLGTRLTVLSLPQNLRLLIIDEPNHPGHYEEQAPHYYTLTVAKYWQNHFGVDLLEGDVAPNLKQINDINHHRAIRLKSQNSQTPIQISLIDMTKEKSILSHPLRETLISAKKQDKTMLLFIPRRGFGKITRCMDCEFAYQCPRCNVPLIFHERDELVHCHYCNYKEKIPSYCPHCGSTNLKTFGWGTERIAGWLKENLNITPIQFDSEQRITRIPKHGIFVATQMAFRYLIEPDIVGVIGADLLLNQPDFATEEMALKTLLHLKSMAKEKLLIQTDQPNLTIFQAIKNDQLRSYLNHLLTERQKFGYPPFGKLIKLTYEHQSSVTAEKKALQLTNKIAQSDLPTRILGPTPAYLPKRRDRYIWQIVLKSTKQLDLNKLRKLLENNWKVTVDPASLL